MKLFFLVPILAFSWLIIEVSKNFSWSTSSFFDHNLLFQNIVPSEFGSQRTAISIEEVDRLYFYHRHRKKSPICFVKKNKEDFAFRKDLSTLNRANFVVEILVDWNLEGVFVVTLVLKKGFTSVGFRKFKWNLSVIVIYCFGRVSISLAVLKRYIVLTELSEDSNFESNRQDDPAVNQMRNHRCYRWFRRSFAYLLNIYKNFWSFYQELTIFETAYLDSCLLIPSIMHWFLKKSPFALSRIC